MKYTTQVYKGNKKILTRILFLLFLLCFWAGCRPSLESLENDLKSENKDVRSNAVASLGRKYYRDTEAILLLCKATSDKDEWVAANAAYNLCLAFSPWCKEEEEKLRHLPGRKATIKALSEALNEDRPIVVSLIIKPIGNLEEESFVNPLIKWYTKHISEKEEDIAGRDDAVWTIYLSGKEKSIPLLQKILREEKNTRVRKTALEALDKMGVTAR